MAISDNLLTIVLGSRGATPDWAERGSAASLPPRLNRRGNYDRRHNDRRRIADEDETVLDVQETGSVGSVDRGKMFCYSFEVFEHLR